MEDPQGPMVKKATASSPSAAGLADCSEAVCAALRRLQEGYAAAQVRVQELQEQKAALKADARRVAEHLFGELSASQQREAQLAAEVEQLRALQAELAEAAAAEAESCRSGVQDAKAVEAQALGRVAALEHELQQARETAHRLEVELQDSRARAVVDKEAWRAHSDKLGCQLEAAEATAAAQRQAAELWQRKHGLLEEQLKGMHAQNLERQADAEELRTSLKQAEAQAREAHLVAKSFRQAVASSLQDLSDLCSALQTAQVAMAADSSSKPAYLQALSLIQSSLIRVAGTAEAALSSVGIASAAGRGVHGRSRAARDSSGSPQAAALELEQQHHPQQQQQQAQYQQQQQAEVQQEVHAILQGSSAGGASEPHESEVQLHEEGPRGDVQPASILELPYACRGSANVPEESTHAVLWGREGQDNPQEGAQQATAEGSPLASSLHGHHQQQHQQHQQEREPSAAQQPLGEAPPSFIQAFRAKHGRPHAAGRPQTASAPDLASWAVEGGQSRPASVTCKHPLALPTGKQQQPQQLASAGPQHQGREGKRLPRPARAADVGDAAAALPAARPARHGSGPRAEASPALRRSPELGADLPTSAAAAVGNQRLAVGAAAASQPGSGAVSGTTQALVLHPEGGQQSIVAAAVALPGLAHGGPLAPGQAGAGRRRAPMPGSTAALPGAAAAVVASHAAGGAAFSGTRDSLTAVIMSVEDELATLDLRHAALLKQSAALREAKALPGDVSLELQREEVAGVMRSVREAMQRKGQQLAQLKQYRDLLGAAL